MHELSAAELLDAWERGHAISPQASAVVLLEATAVPGSDEGPVLDIPVGVRDGRLIELRERLFGTTLSAALTCRTCGEPLELTFATADIRTRDDERTTDDTPAEALITLTLGDRRVAARLPTTRDLLALEEAPDVDAARRELVLRCLVADGGEPRTELSESDLVAVEAALEAADPQADVRLETTCVACGSPVDAAFDIVVHLGAELEAWARRTLHEVASLAASYGWAERDILAMSAWRRQAYLRAAGG
jgi:hypothetical protein